MSGVRAWWALIRRYAEVFRHAWSQREGLRVPDLRPHEAEFLPATLALEAAPVSPASRWLARTLGLLVVFVVAWAFLGQVDIIVDAPGRVVPSGRTRTITAMEIGVVRRLDVSEGQHVAAGQTLLELDTRASDSERDKAVGDEDAARLQIARSQALLEAISDDHSPHLRPLQGISTVAMRDAERQLADQWGDYAAKRSRIRQDVRRFGAALPLATQRAADFQALAETHDVSRHAWMEKEQERIDLEGELRDAQGEEAALTAETRKSAQDALYEAQRSADDASQDARRASAHSELLTLKSPVDGVVQQLSIHTIGSAVPAAQPLMQVVPDDGPIEVEAMVENRDIGFVREGQVAEVKLEAFSYTKYGTIPGRVVHVSRDAIQDDKKGWLYSMKIALDRSYLVVDGKPISLSPGMTATADIRTGERRLIEYVLSPLTEHVRESLHER